MKIPNKAQSNVTLKKVTVSHNGWWCCDHRGNWLKITASSVRQRHRGVKACVRIQLC